MWREQKIGGKRENHSSECISSRTGAPTGSGIGALGRRTCRFVISRPSTASVRNSAHSAIAPRRSNSRCARLWIRRATLPRKTASVPAHTQPHHTRQTACNQHTEPHSNVHIVLQRPRNRVRHPHDLEEAKRAVPGKHLQQPPCDVHHDRQQHTPGAGASQSGPPAPQTPPDSSCTRQTDGCPESRRCAASARTTTRPALQSPIHIRAHRHRTSFTAPLPIITTRSSTSGMVCRNRSSTFLFSSSVRNSCHHASRHPSATPHHMPSAAAVRPGPAAKCSCNASHTPISQCRSTRRNVLSNSGISLNSVWWHRYKCVPLPTRCAIPICSSTSARDGSTSGIGGCSACQCAVVRPAAKPADTARSPRTSPAAPCSAPAPTPPQTACS